MPLTPQIAITLFVGGVLLTLAPVPLLGGRRVRGNFLLSAFLLLVAVNYVAVGLHELAGNVAGHPLQVIANLALALDPALLLALSLSYPFPRRSRAGRILLAIVATGSVASAALVVLRPEGAFLAYGIRQQAVTPERSILIGNLAVGYLAAWLFAVRAARDAPTGSLARRAAWLATAVGVAVVPRLGLLPADFALDLVVTLPFADAAGSYPPWRGLVPLAMAVPLTVATFVAGVFAARGARETAVPTTSLALRRVAGTSGGVLLGAAALSLGPVLGLFPDLGSAPAYGLRWFVFGFLLAHGVLAYDVVEARAAAETVFPIVGAFAGALAAFLATHLLLEGATESAAGRAALSAAVALGALVPAGFATRAGMRALDTDGGGGDDRSYELYQAAVEAAWARGPPSAEGRRRLESDRRAFSLSPEAARALEAVVATRLLAQTAGLRPGDEPCPGVVIEGVLAEGAQARVFAARREPSGDAVVVKQLHPDAPSGERGRRRRLAELRALRTLSHPGIVRLLDSRTFRGLHVLVFERVDGGSISDALAKGPVPPARVRAWALELLDALGAAHARGVVHRDLKPANVLLRPDGRVVLIDFGVATVDGDEKSVRATVTNLEAVGEIVGTLSYMSPEQARGRAADARSDLYQLGLLIHEALAGRRALDLRGLDLYDALERVAEPRLDLEAIPAAWRPALARALDPDPDGRFASAAAMRAEIDRLDPR